MCIYIYIRENLYRLLCIHLILARCALMIASFFLRPPRTRLDRLLCPGSVVSRGVRGPGNTSSSMDGILLSFNDRMYLTGEGSGRTYRGSVLATSSFITHTNDNFWIYSVTNRDYRDLSFTVVRSVYVYDDRDSVTHRDSVFSLKGSRYLISIFGMSIRID